MKTFPWAILLTLLFLSVVFCINILASGANLGISDWDQHLAYYESARRTVVEYRQFPLWDAYHCSGIPALGNPQSEIISLTFLLILAFGTVVGVKISLVAHFFIGAAGFYLLSRYLKLSRWGAFFASIVFTFSGVTASALAVGMTQFLYFFYTPYFIYFLLKALKGKKKLVNVLLSSLVLSLMYYGGYQVPILIIPVLGVFLVLKSIFDKSLAPVVIGISLFILFTLFSSPKLYLNFKLMSAYPREIEDISGYNLGNLIYFTISPKQNIGLHLDIRDFSYGIDENSLYLGIIPVIFFLIGIVKTKNKPLVYILGLVVLWLMLGNTTDFSLYELLRKLPLYDNFRVAQRFRFVFLIIFSLLAARGYEYLRGRFKNYQMFLNTIPLLVFVLLFNFANRNLLNYAFIVDPDVGGIKSYPKTNYPINVDSLRVDYRYLGGYEEVEQSLASYKPASNEFIAVGRGLATTDCYDPIPTQRSAAAYGSKSYLGYAHKNGKVQEVQYWSPQKMTISLSEKGEGVLTINQSYDPGWHAKTANGEPRRLFSKGNLIGVNTLAGDNKIILYYNPF